jgi:N-acetylneuraminate synthase
MKKNDHKMKELNYKKPRTIAEIGCNHKGEFEIAKELIDLAKFSGADIAKFQKRNNKELLNNEQYHAPHPNPYHAYGETYGLHREFLEFSFQQHKELKDYCESVGIEYSTSVWDTTSAKEIIGINPSLIKVPSACNNNLELLKILRDDFSGEVHISLGMTTKEEEENIIRFFQEKGGAETRLVIYACTSGYPVPFEDVSLLEIKRLYENYEHQVKEIGFSGHHLGIAIDIAAFTLGANTIERHFTKDRTWKGTDHAASLEPDGFRKLVRDLNATYKSLTYKNKEILDIEWVQRDKLKYKNQ